MENVSAKFDATPVDYTKVAQQVLSLKPRALTPPQFDDVLSLIEWMHGEVVAQHEANISRANALNLREQELLKREKELAIRTRTVNVAAGFKSSKRSYFWR